MELRGSVYFQQNPLRRSKRFDNSNPDGLLFFYALIFEDEIHAAYKQNCA